MCFSFPLSLRHTGQFLAANACGTLQVSAESRWRGVGIAGLFSGCCCCCCMSGDLLESCSAVNAAALRHRSSVVLCARPRESTQRVALASCVVLPDWEIFISDRESWFTIIFPVFVRLFVCFNCCISFGWILSNFGEKQYLTTSTCILLIYGLSENILWNSALKGRAHSS